MLNLTDFADQAVILPVVTITAALVGAYVFVTSGALPVGQDVKPGKVERWIAKTSLRATIGRQRNAGSRTQFYVQSSNGGAGLSPQLAAAIAARPGVRGVTEVRQTNATVNGKGNRNVDGVDPSVIGQFTDLGAACELHSLREISAGDGPAGRGENFQRIGDAACGENTDADTKQDGE